MMGTLCLFVVAWCSVPSSEQIISLVGFIWTNRGWFSDQSPWDLICHHLSLDCLHPQISLISPISSSQHKHMLCWSPVKMNLVRLFFPPILWCSHGTLAIAHKRNKVIEEKHRTGIRSHKERRLDFVVHQLFTYYYCSRHCPPLKCGERVI
jgi:hypothetical protein